jgi:hypothetical protein
MKAIRKHLRVLMLLAITTLMVACTQPTSDAGGLQDEFEVAILAPRGGEATGKSTINGDSNVTKVYAKVFNSSRVHLTAVDATSDISGVTKLIYDSGAGKWSATVRLAAPASGTITFMIWAENSSGEHLYSGDGNLVVGSGTSITVTTGAGYSLRDMGPAGGYIFYDQGSYNNGWRYLEAARAGWSGNSYDPGYIFGHYIPYDSTAVGTTTAVGTGEANTAALVGAMGSAAHLYTYGGGTTANYAAKVCADYIGGAYEDWFLPSKDELSLMYDNLKAQTPSVGVFSIYEGYWSSSEEFTDPALAYRYAWALYIDAASAEYYPGTYRQNSLKVRPVRSF